MSAKAILIFMICLSGCSTEQLYEGAYHALSNKECMDTHGYPDCNKQKSDYHEYKKQSSESQEKEFVY